MDKDRKDQVPIILNALESQLNQRLEKLWRVFSWCSSILKSISAGVIAASASMEMAINDSARLLISAVIFILTTYAWLG